MAPPPVTIYVCAWSVPRYLERTPPDHGATADKTVGDESDVPAESAAAHGPPSSVRDLWTDTPCSVPMLSARSLKGLEIPYEVISSPHLPYACHELMVG